MGALVGGGNGRVPQSSSAPYGRTFLSDFDWFLWRKEWLLRKASCIELQVNCGVRVRKAKENYQMA